MRHSVIAAAAAALLLAGPTAVAAPTCDNRNGETVKCGTAGAMPVGWAPSPADVLDHSATPPELNPAEAVALIYIVGGFFALLALMPPFDGWREGDWDEQEEDSKAATSAPAASRPSTREARR
jgi:hypothetical protein